MVCVVLSWDSERSLYLSLLRWHPTTDLSGISRQYLFYMVKIYYLTCSAFLDVCVFFCLVLFSCLLTFLSFFVQMYSKSSYYYLLCCSSYLVVACFSHLDKVYLVKRGWNLTLSQSSVDDTKVKVYTFVIGVLRKNPWKILVIIIGHLSIILHPISRFFCTW